MKERDVSLRVRRTTRVAMRIPLLISVRNSSGNPETVSAWTMVVNKHGARCESTRRFEVNEEVEITSSLNKQKMTGKVIWCGKAPAGAVNFEFAIELHEPSNPWRINFPPGDWQEEADSPPAKATSTENSSASHQNPESETPRPEGGTDASAPDNKLVNTAPEIPEWEAESIVAPVPDTDLTADLATLIEPAVTAAPVGASFHATPQPISLPYHSQRPPEAPAERRSATTDRLTEVVTEVVESALRSRIETEADRLVETRIVQLSDWGQKIAGEALQRIAEASEERFGHIEAEAEKVVSISLDTLINRIMEQIPPLEEQVLGRCKSESEQLASASLDKVRHILSDQMDEISERLAQREQALLQAVADSERRTSEALEKTASRLEAQMAESAKTVVENLFRGLIQSIHQTQENLLTQAEIKIEAASEKDLRETRSALARSLREIAEAITDPRHADATVREARAEFGRVFIRPYEEAAGGTVRAAEEKELPHPSESLPVPADAPVRNGRVVTP